MKYAKTVAVALMIALLASCAKPPQAEVDAAKSAVAKAAADVDVVSYAPDSLRRAQDALSAMQTELQAKRYDKAKTLAEDAARTANAAVSEAQANKERVKAQALALIDAAKKALPQAEKTLAAAASVRNAKLDLKALAALLSEAKASLAGAEKDQAAGSYLSAKDKAAGAQARLADLDKTVSAAVQTATRKK